MLKQRKSLSDMRSIVGGLRSTYVKTARDEQFGGQLDRLLQCDEHGKLLPKPVLFNATGETRGIALIDGAGGGKTSLVNRFLSRHPAFKSPTPGTTPWLSIRVPSPATLKSLGLEILRVSGYPDVSESRRQWHVWQLVRTRLALLGVVVLWIDEAHDLFRNSSQREVEDILKTLKSLMQGEGAVIVVLTGIETLWQIASFDDQVKRRYSKIELPAVTGAADGGALWKLIGQYCVKAGLEVPERGDLVERLIHASRARFGRCIENIINGIEVA